MFHQIRIQSDGTANDTVITDEMGNQIPRVRSITINTTAGEVVTASLEVMLPVIDMHASVEEVQFHCPFCKFMYYHSCTGLGT